MDSPLATWICGIVVETDSSSIRSASHSVALTAQVADFLISTIPLYVAIHQSLDIDLEMIVDAVSLPIWITLEPVSWCWPAAATATPSWSERDLSHFKIEHGYNIVTPDPRLPFTRSKNPSSSTIPLLVLRLYVLIDQFSTELYLIWARLPTYTSTQPAWRDNLLNFGALHHSI